MCEDGEGRIEVMMRVAFCGASGTGKSTLAEFVAKTYGFPMNPVGSRSVSKAMGFENPYDVDKAGKRAEFQWRLLCDKVAWEAEHESFVTDRTVVDNVAYLALHDSAALDSSDISTMCDAGMRQYTHIIYTPLRTFQNLGGDPARREGRLYHECFDAMVEGLVLMYFHRPASAFHLLSLDRANPTWREQAVLRALGRP